MIGGSYIGGSFIGGSGETMGSLDFPAPIQNKTEIDGLPNSTIAIGLPNTTVKA